MDINSEKILNKFSKNSKEKEKILEVIIKILKENDDNKILSDSLFNQKLLLKYLSLEQDNLGLAEKITKLIEVYNLLVEYAITNQKDLNNSINSENVKLTDPFDESFSTTASDQKEANIEITSVTKNNVEAIGQIKLLNPDLASSNLTDAILEVNQKAEFPNIKFATGENVAKTSLSENGRGYLLRLGDKEELNQKITDNSLIIDNLSANQTETQKDVDNNTESINKNITSINDNTKDIEELRKQIDDLKKAKAELPIGTIIALSSTKNPNNYLSGTWEKTGFENDTTLISTNSSSQLGVHSFGSIQKHNHRWCTGQYYAVKVEGKNNYGHEPISYFISYDSGGHTGKFGRNPGHDEFYNSSSYAYTHSTGTSSHNYASGYKVFFWERIR